MNKADVDTSSSFYNNQGRQYRFNRTDPITIGDTIIQANSLYIPSSWKTVDLDNSSTYKTATFWSSIYNPPPSTGQGPFTVFGFKNVPFSGLTNQADQNATSDYMQFVAWKPNFGYYALNPKDFPVVYDGWNDLVMTVDVKEGTSTSRSGTYTYYVNGRLAATFENISIDDSVQDIVFLINTVNGCAGFTNYNAAVCTGSNCCIGSTYDTYRTIDGYITSA